MTVILPSHFDWDDDDVKESSSYSSYYYDGGYYKGTTKPATSYSPWWKGKFTSRYKSSLGYSSSTLYDSTSKSYTSYKTSYTDPKNRDQVMNLLTSAYKSVREVVVILDFPFDVRVCFSGMSFDLHRKKKDNTRFIYLSTECLDDKTQSDSRKIDVLCGIGIHEAAHLRYSEVKVINSFVDLLKKSSEYNEIKRKIIVSLVNLLEDERVEDKLLKERPGYVTYLTTKKSWEFEHNEAVSNGKSFSTVLDIFNMIVRFIRYKDEITEDDIPEKYKGLFLKVGELVSPIYNNPTLNMKNTCTLGESLFKLISEELNPSDSEYSQISHVKYCSGIFSGLDIENPDISCTEFRDTSLVDSEWLRMIERIAQGTSELVDKNILFSKVLISPENKTGYEEVKRKVSKYIPSIRRTLVSQAKDYDYTIHGCRSGLLDTTKLAEAYQGVPQVYQRLGHVSTSKMAVCVLVDESGSMHHAGKELVAKEAAILLNEALSSVPGVELFIYGHSADYTDDCETGHHIRNTGLVDITIYKEPGMQKSDCIGMDKISAKYENRDGDAILSVAKRIRKYTKEYCVMFVISDGSPCAIDYSGYSAVGDTAKKIKKAETNYDMDIIGVCIDSVPQMGEMYSSHIDLRRDLSLFAKNLGKIIKTKILNNRETTTTS